MAASGAVLFASDSRALSASGTFQLKLALIAAALANAALFRLLWRERAVAPAGAPFAARVMAAVSVLLWLGVGTAGRMIAYT